MQDGNNEKNAPIGNCVSEYSGVIGNTALGSKRFIDGVSQLLRDGGLFVSSISSSRNPRLDPSLNDRSAASCLIQTQFRLKTVKRWFT